MNQTKIVFQAAFKNIERGFFMFFMTFAHIRIVFIKLKGHLKGIFNLN